MTRAVAALEDHLQSRLLNRTTRSVSLTDEGARYLESCRRLLAAYDELEAMNLGERAQPRGTIRPSLVRVRSVIGYGSPALAGTPSRIPGSF